MHAPSTGDAETPCTAHPSGSEAHVSMGRRATGSSLESQGNLHSRLGGGGEGRSSFPITSYRACGQGQEQQSC